MEKTGKMMWALTVKPNWMRASVRALRDSMANST
jgi:hypothetical protein